ncbi:MAG: hypothetical protein LBM96_13185 [Methanobrevibacter sp.]|jgi:hypothetical protein|nr:hypothetical protein [Candidatus Methanoflexus mossambicus]
MIKENFLNMDKEEIKQTLEDLTETELKKLYNSLTSEDIENNNLYILYGYIRAKLFIKNQKLTCEVYDICTNLKQKVKECNLCSSYDNFKYLGVEDVTNKMRELLLNKNSYVDYRKVKLKYYIENLIYTEKLEPKIKEFFREKYGDLYLSKIIQYENKSNELILEVNYFIQFQKLKYFNLPDVEKDLLLYVNDSLTDFRTKEKVLDYCFY